jgi:hypothetical protein
VTWQTIGYNQPTPPEFDLGAATKIPSNFPFQA